MRFDYDKKSPKGTFVVCTEWGDVTPFVGRCLFHQYLVSLPFSFSYDSDNERVRGDVGMAGKFCF